LNEFPKLTVFLTCHDRLEWAIEAHDSILNQTFKQFLFVVSDNSTTARLGSYLGQLRTSAVYRYRGNVDQHEHWKIIFSEIETEYFCIFHDDDIMLPNFLEVLMDTIEKSELLAAVGCSALVINGTGKQRGLFKGGIKSNQIIDSPRQVFKHYAHRRYDYHVPFPSYVYRARLVHSVPFDLPQCGKHADVYFLMDIASRAQILWIPQALMHYRMHDGNDRTNFDLGGRLALIRKAVRLCGRDSVKTALIQYRFTLYCKILVHHNWNSRLLRGTRNRRLFRFILYKSGVFLLSLIMKRTDRIWGYIIRR